MKRQVYPAFLLRIALLFFEKNERKYARINRNAGII